MLERISSQKKGVANSEEESAPLILSPMKFEIYQASDSQLYFFRLVDEKGEVWLRSSEGYVEKGECERGVEAVMENGGDESKYNVKLGRSENNLFLVTNNGHIIGVSEKVSEYAISTISKAINQIALEKENKQSNRE